MSHVRFLENCLPYVTVLNSVHIHCNVNRNPAAGIEKKSKGTARMIAG